MLGGAESRGPGSFSFGVSEKLNNLPSTSDEYTGQGTEVAPASDDLAKSLWVIPEKPFGFFPTRFFRQVINCQVIFVNSWLLSQGLIFVLVISLQLLAL